MKKAFSLIELSIVLVILGLITGGILAGQSLIRGSEIKSVISDVEGYVAAVKAFQTKYKAFPGDMPNATSIWGDNSTACPSPSIADGSPGTCNGNDSRYLDFTANGINVSSETLQFWNQLALAGFIQGSYLGTYGNPATSVDKSPTSRIANAYYIANGCTNGCHLTGQYFDINLGNYIELSAIPANPSLSPSDAWSIDSKIDDGKPAYGKVVSRYWNDLCTSADSGGSSATNLAASYRVTDTALRCNVLFRNLP